ncbi:Malonyl-CoA-acyl carrier protein transacylase, mitochondrial [Tetrabaena socialis]|uniref:Malonyl-CoA-acyl carrier protein transacylase, mitochondrial n=1 Tax=Tetrabaena socialis TaxID=47790 RepID=A0A2J7ZY84_9CHLO|nr:Malonyl-CoA-acyl carrier protein transacylase, mitochondrial [Tetrabaena socialis]|eukprot:PNH05234.1 Malonyl-CoA-acyl carrier protein transacylase, mitochondrial [Tetrabaena socialis]
MPRDLSGCGRHPPQPRYAAFAFYSAIRVGDPEMLSKIMQAALDDTRVAQPALFVAGLAAVEVLRQREPGLVDACSAAAGLSLGEYTALVFAGAMSFEEGLRAERRKAKELRREKRAAFLAALAAGGDGSEVLAAYGTPVPPPVAAAVAAPPPPTAGGPSTSAAAAAAAGAPAPAAPPGGRVAFVFPGQALGQVQFRAPRMPVLSNVTAAPFPSSAADAPGSPADIPGLLARQLVEPVQWESSLAALLAPPAGPSAPEAGSVTLYELGPGQQIKAMVKRMSLEAWRRMGGVQP